ncbi:MAG: hypothetical protein QOI89_3189 [Solirubrobacteraceae bacterium]|nr:hypothetical protein [Solirubrobacteraceae bacterium]
MDAEGATATSITVGFTMYRGRQRHPHRLRLLRSNVTGPREFVLDRLHIDTWGPIKIP